jgi:perosamine synthetase
MLQNIPLAIPSLIGNEKKYLNECIDTGFVSSVGLFVNQFEEMLTQETKAKNVIVVSSGTCALSISLIALGVSHNDLVITPSLTFIATANAVSHCGALPWVFDISPVDWGLDPVLLEETLTAETYKKNGFLFHKVTHQRIAAIIPVYALGLPCDIDGLKRVADMFKLPLVVDAAAGIGSMYHQKPLGLHGGDIMVLSFNGNKNITSGGGGAILSNNDSLAKKIKHISTTARIGPNYDHDEVGYNYRMTNLQAAVGCAQLEQLAYFQERKAYISNFYKDAFQNISEITFFPSPTDRKSSYWLSGFVLKDSRSDLLFQFLRNNEIESKPFWKPIHLQIPYLHSLKTTMTKTEFIWDKIVTLPSSTSITEMDLERVSQSVLKFFRS